VAANSSEMRPVEVLRPVIARDYLQIRVINFQSAWQARRQLFFFVTRREENRDARTIGVGCGREILDPRKGMAP